MNITKTEYKNIGEIVYSGTLDNGLQIRVIPKKGFSSFYAVFGTNYGGAMRTFELDGKTIDTPAGVAHFLEHKMFDLPDGDNALDLLSENGADPNAFTSSGYTCYYFHCTSKFEENLKILLHFVSTPYFTPETVEKEQGIIGQEIRMVEDMPGNVIYYNLMKLLYDHHPIREDVAGTVESIAEITDKTLYDCHKVFYAPSNMVLCVEGDVIPEDIFKIAENELPKEYSSVPKAYYGEKETLFPVSLKKEASMEVSAPQFLFGAKLDPDADLKSRLISSLSAKLLFGSSSPFYTRLYEDGTLHHDFDADVDYTAGTGTFIVGGESENPDKVYDEMLKEVENLDISDDYFNLSKKSVLGSKLRSYEDFESTCVAVEIGVLENIDILQTLSVLETICKDDCIEFIKNTISKDKIAVSIINPIKN